MAAPRDHPQERIDALIAAIPDWRRETFARVRAVFLAADPGIVEEFKWMGTPVWSCDGMIAVANAFKGRVNITFAYGAKLPDPAGLFNAFLTSGTRRGIDLFEGDEINAPALTALIRAGIVHNRTHLKKNARAKPGRPKS
jgi:hypothetical protein